MMSPRPFLFAVAAVAVALGTTAATVSPSFAADRGVLVEHEDLNLASAAGRAVLDARIERAARLVCGTAFINELDIAAGVDACLRDVLGEARRQRDAILGGGYASLRLARAAS
jgi:UrcA family protein